MLLIAGLIQPLTQQPRYYLLTTIRQPLRHISWFVPTTRSRLARGPPRPTDAQVATHGRPVAAGASASTGTDLSGSSSLPRPQLTPCVVVPGGRFTAYPTAAHALLLLPQEACSCPVLVLMPTTRRPC